MPYALPTFSLLIGDVRPEKGFAEVDWSRWDNWPLDGTWEILFEGPADLALVISTERVAGSEPDPPFPPAEGSTVREVLRLSDMRFEEESSDSETER